MESVLSDRAGRFCPNENPTKQTSVCPVTKWARQPNLYYSMGRKRVFLPAEEGELRVKGKRICTEFQLLT